MKISQHLLIVVFITPLLCSVGATSPTNLELYSVSTRSTVQKIENEREQLDEKIWANEVLAQKYEKYFINLWDSIRTNDDKLPVLGKFKFGELITGKLIEKKELKWGIMDYQFGDEDKVYSQQEWVAWLNEMANHYSLIQTEWHHAKFLSSDSGNQSEIKAKLHLTNLIGTERYILEVMLKVKWSTDKDSHGNFYPMRIDASNLKILERKAGPVFSERLRARSTLNANAFRNVILYDLNGDGLSEIILPEGNVLYWNKGNFEFERDKLCDYPTKRIGISLVADLTGDGRPELLVIPDEYPVLYRLDDEGRYSSVGEAILATVKPFDNPWAITAGDINKDGLLDLWVGQYKPPYFYGQMPTPFYDANDGYPSYLLVNLGDGRFKDQTEDSGLAPKRFRRTYSSSFVDLNGDDHLDLLVVSDFSGTDVYFNKGNGTFTDVTSTAIDERSAFGMSHTFGDFNLDGRLDFYISGMGSTTARRLENMGLGREDMKEITQMRMPMAYGNRMYLASSDGKYRQPPFIEQVNRTGWSWGMSTFDFDSDLEPDVYIANGNLSLETAEDYCTVFWTHDIYTGSSNPDPGLENFFGNLRSGWGTEAEGGWNPYEKNVLFMNLGGKSFVNVSFLMGAAFVYDARSVVTEDLDLDGRPDLIVTSVDWIKQTRGLHVYQNLWPVKNNWVGVRLPEGKGYSPFGAKVTVVSKSGNQILPVVTGDSHLAQHSTQKHFGLGTDKSVNYIEVRWPNGHITRVKKPSVNQYHRLTP